ncbi:hypothetical protein D9M68_612910 [compost metagenome]
MVDAPVRLQGAEGGQFLQIVRGPDGDAFHQAGGCHQECLGRAQRAGDQRGVLVTFLAHPQGHVHAFLTQVHAAVGEDQVQLNQRVALEEFGDDGLQQRVRHLGGAGHSQAAAGLGREARHRLVRLFGFGEHGLAVAQVALADIGQRQLAGGALQQAHAQARFQFGDAPREARLGHPQQAAGGGEAAVLDDFGEIEEIVEVLHGFVLRVGRTIAPGGFPALLLCLAGLGNRLPTGRPGSIPDPLPPTR